MKSKAESLKSSNKIGLTLVHYFFEEDMNIYTMSG